MVRCKIYHPHVNSPPNQPGVIANNSGNASRQPSMSATLPDPDEVLPNGQAYDYLAAYYRELWWVAFCGGTGRSPPPCREGCEEVNSGDRCWRRYC